MDLPAGFSGAVPMCYSTGGLAIHYRFGARTGGASIMLGVFFIFVALLVFPGLECCPLLRSLKTNDEYFIVLLIAGIALAVPNMVWAFGVGIAVGLLVGKMKIRI
jgi:SulP family sulfate permease